MRGYTMNAADYLNRLRRIEGQLRGIQRLVSQDATCVEMLTQMSAVTNALHSVALGLLDEHIRGCVADATTSGDRPRTDVMMAEANDAIKRLIES